MVLFFLALILVNIKKTEPETKIEPVIEEIFSRGSQRAPCEEESQDLPPHFFVVFFILEFSEKVRSCFSCELFSSGVISPCGVSAFFCFN